MADNKISIELTLEQAEALKSITNIEKRLNQFASNASNSGKKVDTAFSSLGQTILGVFGGNLLTKAFENTIGALQSLGGAIVSVTQAGIEAADAENRLATSL